MRRLRIAVCCEATQGGVRKHLWELLTGLQGEEFEFVGVFSVRDEYFRRDLARYRERGIRVVEVPMSREIRLHREWAAYFRLKRALSAIQPDILHTHSSKAGMLGRVAGRRLGLRPIVHTPHVYAFQYVQGWRRRFYRACERFAGGRCDHLVAVGPGQRQATLEARIKAEHQVALIENGVDASRYDRAEQRASRRAELGVGEGHLVIGMVARLEPQKGLRHFLEAAAAVAGKYRDQVRFVLIGSGSLEPEVRARAAALSLEAPTLTLLGHREDATEFYPAFDIFLLSSLYEGLPYVLLEAMASWLPVVATRVPGSEDVVEHGRTGFLCDLHQAEAIAASLARLIEEDELRRRMGEEGRKLVERRFTLDRFLEEHARLYRELYQRYHG